MDSDKYEYHELYLDSSDATQGITAGVDPLNWPLYNLPFQLNDIESFKVLQVEIPNSYCVSDGATFRVDYYPAYSPGSLSTPVSRTYSFITTGTPSGQQIAADLSTKLAADSAIVGAITGWGSNYLKCTFVPGSSTSNGVSNYLFETITTSSGSALNSNLDFTITISDQRSEDVIGFRLGTFPCAQFGTTGTAVKSLRSARPVLVTGPPYIYVSSNAVGNLCRTYLPAGAALLSGGVSSPQMAKVPVTASPGSFIIWNDSNSSHWYKVDTISTLSQIDIYCQLGNYGGYINFQGLNFSIKLGVLIRKQTRTTFGGSGGFTNAPAGYLFPNR
jgi:hypothetical protein